MFVKQKKKEAFAILAHSKHSFFPVQCGSVQDFNVSVSKIITALWYILFHLKIDFPSEFAHS